jgi:hypothetical protein
VHDLPAELDNLPQRVLQVGNRQVGKREAVARPGATLVQPDNRSRVVGLEAFTLFRPPVVEGNAEQALPEPAGASEVVGGKLDQ